MVQGWFKFPGFTISLDLSSLEDLDFLASEISEIIHSDVDLRFERFSFGIPNFRVSSVFGLQGGKGGFGKTLRAKKKPARITRNFDSARDLDGNRVGDASIQQRLSEWAERREHAQEATGSGAIHRVTIDNVDETEKPAQKKPVIAIAKRAIENVINADPNGLKSLFDENRPTKKLKGTLLDLGLSSSDDDDPEE